MAILAEGTDVSASTSPTAGLSNRQSQRKPSLRKFQPPAKTRYIGLPYYSRSQIHVQVYQCMHACRYVDCYGGFSERVLDQVCHNEGGQRGVIRYFTPGTTCTDTWPTATASSCKAAFGSE